MRMMVFFDLPTVEKQDKRNYVLFRRFLLNDGYDMIQWSVYGRVVNGFDDEEKHLKRLVANLPPKGSIRHLRISEKQFASMKILLGTLTVKEKNIGQQQLLLF